MFKSTGTKEARDPSKQLSRVVGGGVRRGTGDGTGKLFKEEGKQLKTAQEVPKTDQIHSPPDEAIKAGVLSNREKQNYKGDSETRPALWKQQKIIYVV